MVKPTAGTGLARAEHLHHAGRSARRRRADRRCLRRASRRRGRCNSRAAGRSPPRSGSSAAGVARRDRLGALGEDRRAPSPRSTPRRRANSPSICAALAELRRRARDSRVSVSAARAAAMRVRNGAAVEEALGDLLRRAARASGMAVRLAPLGEQRDQPVAVVGERRAASRSSRTSSASRGAAMRVEVCLPSAPAGRRSGAAAAASGRAGRARAAARRRGRCRRAAPRAAAAGDLARRSDRERQRLRVGGDAIGARRYPRSRSPAAPASPGRGGGRPGPHRRSAPARAASPCAQADGDGEIRPERQPLALRPLGHEHPAADVLARRLQERIGRMQHRHLDEARAGGFVERAEAGGERGHQTPTAPLRPDGCRGHLPHLRGVRRARGAGPGMSSRSTDATAARNRHAPAFKGPGGRAARHTGMTMLEALAASSRCCRSSSFFTSATSSSRRHLELPRALLAPGLVVGRSPRRLRLAGGEVLDLQFSRVEFLRAGDDGGRANCGGRHISAAPSCRTSRDTSPRRRRHCEARRRSSGSRRGAPYPSRSRRPGRARPRRRAFRSPSAPRRAATRRRRSRSPERPRRGSGRRGRHSALPRRPSRRRRARPSRSALRR